MHSAEKSRSQFLVPPSFPRRDLRAQLKLLEALSKSAMTQIYVTWLADCRPQLFPHPLATSSAVRLVFVNVRMPAVAAANANGAPEAGHVIKCTISRPRPQRQRERERDGEGELEMACRKCKRLQIILHTYSYSHSHLAPVQFSFGLNASNAGPNKSLSLLLDCVQSMLRFYDYIAI